jgi:hypothetical protein
MTEKAFPSFNRSDAKSFVMLLRLSVKALQEVFCHFFKFFLPEPIK